MDPFGRSASSIIVFMRYILRDQLIWLGNGRVHVVLVAES
jgi:hypothetical protein